MRGAFALAAVALLAGCVASTDTPTSSTPAPPEDPAVEVQHHNHTFAMTINPDTELIGIGGSSEDCIFFWDTDGAEYTILAGNATLTWDAKPNTPKFRIRAVGATEEAESASGGSPVLWAIPVLEARDWGVGFWVDYTLVDGTAPAAQAVSLSLAFDYTGELPKPGMGTCAGGGV